ncbi:hypothetical protein G9F72_023165 [Clostridium estertheticum]|uniref:hypothetical protein n=1 Tax=Clostridium estertheticum TaxID=238834 RepID=UPI0013E909A1|nr:hypothetical protein [Clostridium estertheticum]MBZ9689203.1 hypothetical protein [Clostridium estertheticum]
MKKTRVIIAAAMVTTMLVGAGYASWTDALKVTSTVTTGSLNVQYDKSKCEVMVFEGDSKYFKPTLAKIEDKNMEVTVENMYPGTAVGIRSRMNNIGSIPVVFDNAVVTFNNDLKTPDALRDALDVEFLVAAIYDKNDGLVKDLSWDHCKLTNLGATINTMLKDVRLEPGQYLTLGNSVGGEGLKHNFYVQLPLGTKGEYQDLQKKTMDFGIQINWKQHNVK